jgi:hypothetical protein
MILMKLVPAIPGHFTIYEWIALGSWIALGIAVSGMPKKATNEKGATEVVP